MISDYHVGDKVVYFGVEYPIEDIRYSPQYKLQISKDRAIWANDSEVKPVRTLSKGVLEKIIEFCRTDFDCAADAEATKILLKQMPGWPEDEGWKLLWLCELILGERTGMCKDISSGALIDVLETLGWRVEP